MKNSILKYSVFVLILSSLNLLNASCKKKCSAGTGGGLTIVAFPQHHGRSIPNQTGYPDTVFLKFNTQNSPGSNPSNYDKYFVGEPGEDHVHLTGLQCGDYYLYAVGKDTMLMLRVVGGIPYSTSQTSGEIDLNVPVSE